MSNTQGAGLTAEVVVKLSREPHTFQALMHSIRGSSDSTMCAALAELIADGFAEHSGPKFCLTQRGRALVSACQRQGRPRGGKRRH
jgi:DNA-binding HxlR family transcriptional regulator